MDKVWQRSEIESLILSNNRAVEKGILAIFERQTADEQSADVTKYNNNVGFCGWAARRGSYYAKWIKSGRPLTGNHLDKARKICLHHACQLTKIANHKM